MSKKQIKKNIKNNSKETKTVEEKDIFYKIVTSITAILLTLILSYFIIGVFVTKEIDFKKNKDGKEDTKEEVTIDNTTITAGQIFDQKDDAYYVIVFDVDSKLTILPSYISSYKSSEGALPIYTVDSKKKFNSKYIVEDNSNKNPTSYSDLKIKSPTLIKVENKKVTSYVEDEDQIKSILKK